MKKLRKYQNVLIITGVLTAVIIGIYHFLISEYSMKHLWFPLAEKQTGFRISAKKCSVSLFGEQTFQGKDLQISGPGFSASAGAVDLKSNPLSFFFGGVYHIHSFSMTGVDCKLTPEEKKAEKNLFRGQPEKGKKRNHSVKNFKIPLTMENVSVEGLNLHFSRTEGDEFSLTDASLCIAHLYPNTQTEIKTNGIFQGRYGNILADKTNITTLIRFTLPESGVIPKNFSLNLNTGKASITAGDFSSVGNTLALIADCELNEKGISLKSGSLSMGNEQGGDILAVNLSGTVQSDLTEGILDGTIKLYPSKLTDALCSDISGTKIWNLSADCHFQSKVIHGTLQSEADLHIKAGSVSPYKKNLGLPIIQPEIHASASLSGKPKELTFTLNKASLSFQQMNKKLGEAILHSPWELVKSGNFCLTPLPHAEIQMKQFPLSTLVPFGLDEKYQGDNLTFSLISELENQQVSKLKIKGSTSFSIAEIGPVSGRAEILFNNNRMELSKCNLFCGNKQKFIQAEMSGVISGKPKSMELNSSFLIRNPEEVFHHKAFRNFPEIKPELQITCTPSDDQLNLWMQLSGGKFRLELLSKAEIPETNTGFWKSFLKNNTDTSLVFRAGDHILTDLLLEFKIPADGTFKGMEISGNTRKISPEIFDELKDFLPQKLDCSTADPKFSFSYRETDNIRTADINLSAKNLQLKKWDQENSAQLDGSFSLRAAVSGKTLELKKVLGRSSLNGNEMIHFDLTGKIPMETPGKSMKLSLVSPGMDLETLQKVMNKLSPQPQNKQKNTESSRTKTVPQKENPFMLPDLSRFHDSSLDLDLRRISYTNDFIAEFKGTADVKNSKLSLNTEKFTVNRRPAKLFFSIETITPENIPFSMSLKVNDFSAAPIIKAASGGEDHKISGTIRQLDLNVKGNGITKEKLLGNTIGTVELQVSKISIPASEATDNPFLRIILIPLQSIDSILNRSPEFSGTSVSKFIQNIASGTKEIITGKKNLDFDTAVAEINLDHGTVTLEKFNFIGGIVDAEDISGYFILPDGKIRIKSELTVKGIILPVYINGTVSDMKVDISESIKKLLQSNAKQLADPENIEKAVKSVNEIIKLFR